MPFFRTLYPIPSDIVAIHEGFVAAIEGYLLLAASGDRTARRQARIVQRADEDFLADVTIVAERTVALANRVIVDQYDAHQHGIGRPQTDHATHLRDALPTSQLVDTGLPSGTVGIVDMEALDKFVYWKAQEFGSDHMVGREIMGFFRVPGTAAPDPSQFRTHALFQPAGRGRVAHFENPIPEGRFIRDGLDLVEVFWSRSMLAAANDAIKDLRAAQGLTRGGRTTRAARSTEYRNLERYRSGRGLRSALRRL